ncbi:hypothetical protein ACFQ4C_04845 [Larkinella insperata]|uniref:Quercetin 2,3-dioxygenase C-terminal cupin domain-containing protein n=1 Tax=Larkinella insperata TaxID=332158 RepID=A0ABW3QK62_9BACT|nr:hypothetical protein [Larkinella insperata]
MAMLTQPEALIYLAEQRGRTQSADYRSFHTFNFGDYRHENRQPFGNLTVFNDDTLLAGKSHRLTVEEPTDLLLLPVVGGIELLDELGERAFLGAGEVFQFTAFPDQSYTIENPFETEAVNFLVIGLKADPAASGNTGPFPATTFDLTNRNQLIPLFAGTSAHIYIGKYGGRQEETYVVGNPQKRLFVFSIEGAFEAQNRLLHPRDGLALWPLEALEFEALSNDAILLVMEV